MTWDMRELVIIGMLNEHGHEPYEDPGDPGWMRCDHCGNGWWVRERAAMTADNRRRMPGVAGIVDPLHFGTCVKWERVTGT